MSVFRIDQPRDVPHFASKLAVENAIRKFGVPYAILRPGYFIQNDDNLKIAISGLGI
ncbi:MAG TPA: NmrA family NAD(P)-binding protein [Terriglobia bacterium]|nr:NmrA family NAD(P)-binding protein [Terriglobia bacterium]